MKLLIGLAIAVLATAQSMVENTNLQDSAEDTLDDYCKRPKKAATNVFTLIMSGMINMEIDVTGHSVTAGQPWPYWNRMQEWRRVLHKYWVGKKEDKRSC